MSGARKRCSFFATMGQRIVSIVITLLILIGCSAKKIAIDCEEVEKMGYHCEDEPRCIRLRRDEFFCEDKVLVRRSMLNMQEEQQVYTKVNYKMDCMGDTEEDPYSYLSLILSTNFSARAYRYSDNSTDGELRVTNCSIPSSNLSVLFRGRRTGVFVRRDILLVKLTIVCKDEETHFSMDHWSGLQNLRELTIRCPKLSKVEEDLLSWISQRLKHLRITDTEIQYLPKRFFSNMKVMETLDLRRNKLRTFRRTFLSSMRNLEKLFLGDNEIESLDDQIFLQTKLLTHLDLEKNSLTTLPTSVCNLRNLIVLNAGYNRISFIPQDCLRSLPSLFSIYLNGNRILTFGLASESILPNCNKVLSSDETLPNSSTTQSRNLKNTWIGGRGVWDLLLENNSLSSLPDEAFYGMVKLKVLKISRNNISHLPESIFSRNKNLYHLLASNNLFTQIPARLLENNTRLRTLDLSHNLIETLHEDFFSNSIKLCHIDISDNRIRRLPDEIFQPFKSQKPECHEFVLDMSRNSLKDVPELSIPELTHLDLSGNHLTFFKTEKLLQPSRLQELNLSHNLLHTIENSDGPVEIKYPFGVLEVIDLSSNQLTELPTFDFKLATLKHLNVSGNNFEEPLSITMSLCHAYLHSLETLDMSRSRLKGMVLRQEYIAVEKMKHMDLSHNFIDLEDCVEAVDARRLVWGCVSPLYSFTELEVIILSHNRIAYIPLEFRHYLPYLRYVDLSHNKIKRLWHGDLLYTRARKTMDLDWFRKTTMAFSVNGRFSGSNNLTIDLRHNSISFLQLQDDKIKVVFPGCDIGNQFSLVKLLLGHNPFVCDCEVYKLLRYASLEMRPTSALERLNGHRLVVAAVIDIQDLHCSEPYSMKGKAIADVESWAYHWLPMIGMCLNHLGVQSKLGKISAKPAGVEAMDKPPT